MAPLVPEILSNEFNLVIAFIVGIGFGYALEQGGFSSTRKLVGLFYGYDFTVLKVFFSAGVTAMTGVIVFGHFGWLDLSVIYVNPMFVWPALIGGGIMGVGFILGGFCPGTSICAAAVGRIDALAFVGGSLLGILAFTEFYPVFEPIMNMGALGNLTLSEVFSMPAEIVGILITIIAVTAFYFTSKIEDRVSGKDRTPAKQTQMKYAVVGALPVIVLFVVFITPNKKEAVMADVEEKAKIELASSQLLDIDKLAFELMNRAHLYNVIDVRDSASFAGGTIPSAVHIPYEDLYDRRFRTMYRQPYKTNIFVGDDLDDVRKSVELARELGDEDPEMLNASVTDFRDVIFSPVQPMGDVNKQSMDEYKFHVQAKRNLEKMEERLKSMRKPVVREKVTIQGGC